MVRYAVGYQSRAFVDVRPSRFRSAATTPNRAATSMTLAPPDPRRDRPALQGAADGDRRRGDAVGDDAPRPRSARRRAHRRRSRTPTRTWRSTTGREAVDDGAPMLAERNIMHVERGGRYRVRERTVLRYYARTIQHLLVSPARAHALMLQTASQGLLPRSRRQHVPESASPRATACAGAADSPAASSPAKRSKKPSTPPAHSRPSACWSRSTYLGESVASIAEADAATRAYLGMLEQIAAAGIERNVSLKLTQLGLTIDRATCVDNLRRILDAAVTQRILRPHRHGELAVHRRHARRLRDDVAAGVPQRRRRAAVLPARAARRTRRA